MNAANDRCECGHPEITHRRSLGPSALDSGSACGATIYETVANGMNAWPCNCRGYSPPAAFSARKEHE